MCVKIACDRNCTLSNSFLTRLGEGGEDCVYQSLYVGYYYLAVFLKSGLQPQIVPARDTVPSEENIHLLVDCSSSSLVFPSPFALLLFYIKFGVAFLCRQELCRWIGDPYPEGFSPLKS